MTSSLVGLWMIRTAEAVTKWELRLMWTPCALHGRELGSWCMAPFVSSALDADEWSASRAGCFTHSTYGVGGWVGPWAVLGLLEGRKMSHHIRESIPRSSSAWYRNMEWAVIFKPTRCVTPFWLHFTLKAVANWHRFLICALSFSV